jgi:subtilase family serine protease
MAATCRFLVLSVAIACAFATGRSHAQGPTVPPAGGAARPAFVQDEILIQFTSAASEDDKRAARGFAGAQQRRSLREGDGGDLEVAALPPGLPVEVAVDLLSRHPAVSFAEPNWTYTRQQESSTFLYRWGFLWGMYGDATTPSNPYGSQAGEAWAAGQAGSRSVVVAVIDQGIDPSHPELAPNMWVNPGEITGNGVDDDGNGYVDDIHGWDFFNDDNSIYDGFDFDFHGTHVAGTIGASGVYGLLVGVNWTVSLVSAKFIGAEEGTTAGAVRALDYLIDLKIRHGLDLVATNNSYGGGDYSQSFHDAIIRAAKAGILFVAAAGNGNPAGIGQDNDATPHYPSNYSTLAGTSTESAATYDSVIAVAAIDSTGGKASFSNYGATSVDLGAPGVGIYSTMPDKTLGGLSGTSMAAPHVTGAVALYASMYPDTPADVIRAAILDSADHTPTASLSGGTSVSTGGRLNIGWFTPVSVDPPAAPSGLLATAQSTSQIALQWADDSSNEETFEIERCEGTGCTAFVPIAQAPRNAVSLSDTGLPGNTTFAYRVRAVNANGASAYSNTDEATTFSDTPPDFVVSAVSAPATAAAGATIAVTDTTTNQGAHPGPESRTGFYLSVNGFFNSNAMFLADRPVPDLASGASDSQATSLVIPEGTATGTYFLIAMADDNLSVYESHEGNNARVALIRIGPDLTVPAVTVPTSAGAGSTTVVSDTTSNIGAGAAAASKTAFYLSANFVLDASDALLGSRHVPSLPPGETSTGSLSVVIPASTPAGTYYVVAEADGDQAVPETLEANNRRFSRAVQIGPDLVVSALTVPAVTGAGEVTVVNDTIKNQGGGDAPASATVFYLSANWLLDASDVPIGSRAVPALAAGATSSASTSVVIPEGTATAAYHVIASADGNAEAAESVETNNALARAIQVGPDLVVSSLTAPNSTTAGSAIAVSDTIKNQGGGSAPPTITAYYLSTNFILDASDVPLGSRTVAGLAPGAVDVGTAEVTVPAGTAPGTYYLFAVTDDPGHLVETGENNNTRFRAIGIK